MNAKILLSLTAIMLVLAIGHSEAVAETGLAREMTAAAARTGSPTPLEQKVELNKLLNVEPEPEKKIGSKSESTSTYPRSLKGNLKWDRFFNNGLDSLERRRFPHAERMLLQSIKEAKTTGAPAQQLIKSRLALARLYLFSERYLEAYDLYRVSENKARSICGPDSIELAECKTGLARCYLLLTDKKRAKSEIEEAERILEKNQGSDNCGNLYGRMLHTMAMVNAEFGWYAEAKELFEKARHVLEKHPGFGDLVLADSLRDEALFYNQLGERKQANQLYDRSHEIKKRFIVTDQPASIAGDVRFKWEVGSTKSRELIDSEFPLRYLTAGNIRVAATVIDLWELMGILITVTNVGQSQQEFGLGEVEVRRVNPDEPLKRTEIIPQVNHKAIDLVQKELSMWTKTHTRPWLANIQKTRAVRGLVPHDGHDLFMGPNVFGVYGHWQAISHTVPERLGIHPSRERIVAETEQRKDIALPGMLRSGGKQFPGLIPVYLEPFESRTGELFYLNHRDCDIVIRVPVGNAIFDIPFHTKAKNVH